LRTRSIEVGAGAGVGEYGVVIVGSGESKDTWNISEGVNAPGSIITNGGDDDETGGDEPPDGRLQVRKVV